ncbi:hypothetical protein CVT24_007708 [Panaeolus cyanescens]|uniref:Uncharacterized protein n=1 Tax=Panaeolus cyanescens TaxID=181874 RepID=A0A409YWS3_9AGAR|nr:hypothetical protein CVT24_007708 [Panaeolus cyanescens]
MMSSTLAELFNNFKFSIGGSVLQDPLVGIQEIKGHLALLRAFTRLKEDAIKHAFFNEFGTYWDDDEGRWRYFVGFAVERFDTWCESLEEKDVSLSWDEFLPPVDVLMVWHAYLLNPLWYAEDAQRIPRCKILAKLGVHLTSALKSVRFPAFITDDLEDVNQSERQSHWQQRTSLDFDPFDSLYTFRKRRMKNLCCGHVDEVEFAGPNMVRNGKGVGRGCLQSDFGHICSNTPNHDYLVWYKTKWSGHLQPTLSRRRCAIQKLARDLVKSTSDPEGYLPGTYLDTGDEGSAKAMRDEGMRVKELLISHINKDERVVAKLPVVGSTNYARECDRFAWDVSKFYDRWEVLKIMGNSELTRRILNTYVDDKVYSVDLYTAVLRHERFMHQIQELNWLVPGVFDEPVQVLPDEQDEPVSENRRLRVLYLAMARYHAFMDLFSIQTDHKTILVPTLDIDLVWHTHMLMHSSYWDDCYKHIGRLVDHEDKVSSMTLSKAFDTTALLWNRRFGVRYSYCGCPSPSEITLQGAIDAVGVISRRPDALERRRVAITLQPPRPFLSPPVRISLTRVKRMKAEKKYRKRTRNVENGELETSYPSVRARLATHASNHTAVYRRAQTVEESAEVEGIRRRKVKELQGEMTRLLLRSIVKFYAGFATGMWDYGVVGDFVGTSKRVRRGSDGGDGDGEDEQHPMPRKREYQYFIRHPHFTTFVEIGDDNEWKTELGGLDAVDQIPRPGFYIVRTRVSRNIKHRSHSHISQDGYDPPTIHSQSQAEMDGLGDDTSADNHLLDGKAEMASARRPGGDGYDGRGASRPVKAGGTSSSVIHSSAGAMSAIASGSGRDGYDETSHLIPHDEEPEETGEVYVDHQKLQERFGHIVRAKEGKMVNVASHIPFNLHNQVIPAESSRASGSRSTSMSNEGRGDTYHPHHSHQRGYNTFNYTAESSASAHHQHSHQRGLLDPETDPFLAASRRSPSPAHTPTSEQPRPTPILNIRLVGYQGKRTRGRARERAGAGGDAVVDVSTTPGTGPGQGEEDVQTPTYLTYAAGAGGKGSAMSGSHSKAVNETLQKLQNAGPIVMSWGD